MRLSIRTKLMSAFTLILIAMGIVGWRGIAGMKDINEGLNEIKSGQVIPSQMIAEANIALIAWNRATLNHVLAESSEKMAEYERIMLVQKSRLLDRIQKLSQSELLSKKGKELVREIVGSFESAEPIWDRILTLSRSDRQEEGRQLMRAELRPIVDTMDIHMTEFLQLQEKQLEQAMKATDARYEQGFRRIFWIMATALVVSFLISFFLSRGILKAVNEMVRGSKSAAAGDLKKAKLVITQKDEFAYLGDVFNQMLDTLTKTITSLERAEAQLKARNAELLASNKALDDFAYIVSHDLREPLRGIRNLSSFMLEDYADKLETKERSKLKRQMQLTQRLENFIESILYYSRIGRTDLSFATVDLNTIVAETIDTLRFSLEQNNVEIRIPKKLPTLWCDPIRVGEVFNNLIANGMKYNARAEKLIEIGSEPGPNGHVIYVRDNGIGIIAKHTQKIFQIFKRLHGRDKYGGGTGAGLTIAKKIIERHGGKIWVESTVGEGTTFYFTLQGGAE